MTVPGLGDQSQVEADLERWVTDAARKAARYQAMQAQVTQISVTEKSKDSTVTVTVDSGGKVTDLRIAEHAMSRSGSQLAGTVLETMRRAQSRLSERIAEVMNETVGEDRAVIDRAVGEYRTAFGPPPDEPPPATGNGTGDPEPPATGPVGRRAARPVAAADDEPDDGYGSVLR
jgi:DNA-binding protein YbaB